jgi:hypothetical protein
VLKYLTDETEEGRHIKPETLQKFRVGAGVESFYNEETKSW